MNLRDLNYVVAVAELKNFSQAADFCAISQPTLSTQIKKLEDYLSLQIFIRQNRNIELTEHGEEIVGIAKRILADVRHMEQISRQAQNPFHGKFSFGAFPSLASYVLPEYVFRMKQHFPDLKLLLVEEKTDSLINLLLACKLDAALLAMPVEHAQLESQVLFEDLFMLAVSPDHPLAGKSSVGIAEIQEENLLLLEEGHCLRDQALKLCNQASFVEDDFRASSLETLRFMVKNGIGVTLMPSVAVQPDDPDIRYIDIEQQPRRVIALVWKKNNPRKKLFQALGKLLSYKPIP